MRDLPEIGNAWQHRLPWMSILRFGSFACTTDLNIPKFPIIPYLFLLIGTRGNSLNSTSNNGRRRDFVDGCGRSTNTTGREGPGRSGRRASRLPRRLSGRHQVRTYYDIRIKDNRIGLLRIPRSPCSLPPVFPSLPYDLHPL